jgi:hypothetical protein
VSFVLTGRRLKISLAIRSESSEYDAINRCILLKEELALEEQSKLFASFPKDTVWTLHRAIMK